MLFDHPEFDDHQQVTFYRDVESGLTAILALHRAQRGRYGGGIRFYPYHDPEDALTDALRLSRAMTYKFALAGYRMGGGKTVVIGDPATAKTPELLRALGERIEGLAGRYVCGPDVGTQSADMEIIHEKTRYVAGLPSAGNTSAPTAQGVFNGLRATVEEAFGTPDLSGLRFAVQGVGNVGGGLCRLIHDTGARLFIADVDADAVRRIADETGATVVAPDDILEQEVDVLCPCALGGVLSEESIPRLRVKAVCGGANNQLATTADGRRLKERGIVFAPDYVVNAGGVIAGSVEISNRPESEMNQRLEAIYETTRAVLTRAREQDIPTDEAARQMAEERLEP